MPESYKEDPQSTNQMDASFTVIINTESGWVQLDNASILEMYFIEDIFSFCLTGRIVFVDKTGFMENAPLTGAETVGIIYGVTENRKLEFRIFSISDVSGLGFAEAGSQQAIEMVLVEPRYILMSQSVFSRSWTSTKISSIVKDISTNMLGGATFNLFEETNETLDYFYMPYWTPLEAIRWLMDKGSGAVSRTPGYLFFQNGEGLNYTTLESLFISNDVEKDDFTKQPAIYKFNAPANDLGLITTWEMSHIDMQSLTTLRGGHRLGYDFKTKGLIDKSYTYSNSISKYTLFGRKSLFRNIDNDSVKYELTGEEREDIIDNLYYSDFIRRYVKQMVLIITVRGHERRHAGQIVNIQWPSGTKSEFFNKNMEGKYMVKSVTHYFGANRPAYLQKMVLIKTGYSDSNDRNLVSATKVNVYVSKQRLGS